MELFSAFFERLLYSISTILLWKSLPIFCISLKGATIINSSCCLSFLLLTQTTLPFANTLKGISLLDVWLEAFFLFLNHYLNLFEDTVRGYFTLPVFVQIWRSFYDGWQHDWESMRLLCLSNKKSLHQHHLISWILTVLGQRNN